MALPTLAVIDGASAPQTVNTLRSGSAASADSAGVAASTEDIARVGIITETAPATDTASSGLNGRLQRIAQRLTTILTGIVLAAGTAVIGKVDHSTTGLGHGVTTVTTAGTDVALAASTPAKWVTVQSQTDNTGWIAVGVTGVDATEATGTGVLLDAGESITLPVDNLADVFIDSTVNGEGVRYTYGT